MPCARFALPVVAAIAVVGIARAQHEGGTTPVDPTRLSERYVIPPGAETLFGEMLRKGETLPGGCTLTEGRIERTSILATYTCGDAPVVLQLAHPEAAARGSGVRTERFAVTVKSGTAPAGLVDAVAERIRARETAFAWKDLGEPVAQRVRSLMPVAAGVVATLLTLWAFRRFAARRRRAA